MIFGFKVNQCFCRTSQVCSRQCGSNPNTNNFVGWQWIWLDSTGTTGIKKPAFLRVLGRSGTIQNFDLVPVAGLEPARGISPADFESAASTNFATLACRRRAFYLWNVLCQWVFNSFAWGSLSILIGGIGWIRFCQFWALTSVICLGCCAQPKGFATLDRLYLPVLALISSFWRH